MAASMRIDVDGGTARVYTPYNSEFVAAIKRGVGGSKWDGGAKCWTVPAGSVDGVREIMRRVYGEDDRVGCEKVNLRVRFDSAYIYTRGDVTLFGKCLSHAYSRDGGARCGDDVCYIEGGCRSGGSVKNWASIVDEGSVAILEGVPLKLYEHWEPEDGVTVTVEKDRNLAFLIAERDELRRCLDSIEAEIAEISQDA